MAERSRLTRIALGTLLATFSAALAEPAEDGRDPLDKVRAVPTWIVPAAPFRVVGPIWFVGSKGLGAWLIEGSAGCVLINTGWHTSGWMIARSLKALGRSPKDIRLLLSGHAHSDHVGGHALLQRLSGAAVGAMKEDVAVLQSGGRAEFPSLTTRISRFPPVNVDVELRDGKVIELGDIRITALHTPGHSRGSTTFVLDAVENGTSYRVVFPDGTGLNPGYRLARPWASYEGIADSYSQTLERLRGLEPDIWLTAHLEVCAFWSKAERARIEGTKAAWKDPAGYLKYLNDEEMALAARLRDEDQALRWLKAFPTLPPLNLP